MLFSFSATTSLDRKWETAGVWRSLLSLFFYVKPTKLWALLPTFRKYTLPPSSGIFDLRTLALSPKATQCNNPRTESTSVIIPAGYSKFEPYRMRRRNCGTFSRKIVSRLFRICVAGWLHPCTSVHCLQSCANTIRSAWRKFRLMLLYEGHYISPFYIMERFKCETNSYFPILRFTSWRLYSYIGMKRKCCTCLD
jgi:hypothetical protein